MLHLSNKTNKLNTVRLLATSALLMEIQHEASDMCLLNMRKKTQGKALQWVDT